MVGDAAESTIAFASWTRLADTPGNQAFVENYRLIKEVKLMKKELLRFTLYAIIIYLTGGALNPVDASPPSEGNGIHFHGVIDSQRNKQPSNQFPNRHHAQTFAANLNVGEPRTVRLIYFLPNDQPYRAEVVQDIKDKVLRVQTFFADQMEAHGYGRRTFRVETDPKGEPLVHRVDGQYAYSDYLVEEAHEYDEIKQMFDIEANIYLFFLIDTDRHVAVGQLGDFAWVGQSLFWDTIAHELGHTFGLHHDFRDGSYIMSYGAYRGLWRVNDRLSACHAEFLSVHPYFNPDASEDGPPPTIELISSPRYPVASQSVPIRLKVRGSAGLHQVLLMSNASIKACRRLAGESEVIVGFNYDGTSSTPINSQGTGTSLSSPVAHRMHVIVVDTEGNVGTSDFLAVF